MIVLTPALRRTRILSTRYALFLVPLLVVGTFDAGAQHWPQAAGPNANWKVEGRDAPLEWSVVRQENVRWRTALPEGGQSAVTIWQNRVFVTTHRPMEEDSDRLEPNVVGYCLDADSGGILWTVDVPGTDPVQTAGIFSDATVFAPVTDGKHVWFFNRCGSIACFDFAGNRQWLRTYEPRKRHTNRQCEPVLVGDLLLAVEVLDKQAASELERHKPVPEDIDPRRVWTFLHAIDKNTGKVVWTGKPGTSVHNTPMVGQLEDGRWAVAHGRGGGHGPLEKPYGASLSLLEDGENLWNLELPGNCYINTHWNSEYLFWFGGMQHHVVDVGSGTVVNTADVRKDVLWTECEDFASKRWVTRRVRDFKPGRRIPFTNQTNVVVGDWHYFLTHGVNAIGRLNWKTGKTEYLQVPVMVEASEQGRNLDKWVWDREKLGPNDTRNSRGIDIVLDKRARKSGWGHVSAASPVLVNRNLYFPVMNGTVYVIDAFAEKLDEKSLLAVNDLGPAYETWTLASFSYAEGRLYTRTMKEVICLESTRIDRETGTQRQGTLRQQ